VPPAAERESARLGLTSAEAGRRLEEYGPNLLPGKPREPQWRRFVAQFRSPLIYILLVALVVDVGAWAAEGRAGAPLEAVAIGVILLLNAALGAWQERRAEHALARLEDLAAPRVRVFRDGRMVGLPAAELVPGDVLRLEPGDRIAADASVRRSASLSVDESVVTGESMPVHKPDGAELLAGTLVVRGGGDAEVTRTGSRSNLGRLAALLGEVKADPTPLERRLVAFGHRIARWVLILALAIVVGGVLVEGVGNFPHVLVFAVALAVAAVPEGLPAVLTLTLALGVERMARRRAVVRRLAAVEALGSVTVIASDKTGTLTENRMEVREVESPEPDLALRAMVLANDSEPGAAVGDPLELALLHYAERQGQDPAALRAGHPRLRARPFDSESRYMLATVEEPGGPATYLKGAPEVVLERSALSGEERAAWRRMVQSEAENGYRVIALARGAGEAETELAWLGLVMLLDPPRPEVPEAMRRARAAGIRVLMITGDHPATAVTTARLAGMEAGAVITGEAFGALDPEGRARAVREINVFARVSPADKLEIVRLLRRDGEVVAVTGDGVNDAPALKQADVGVAMGQRGSDVAREVADLVLLDDNFATIVAAIEEGRSIYENIQKFIRFLFSTNLSEVLVVAVGAFAAFLLGLRDAAGHLLLPLTAAQLLWINLVTDGAPALALGVDRNPGVMLRGPRDPRAPLLDRPSLRFIVAAGTLKALVAAALLVLLPLLLGAATEVTRTATFTFMAAGQLLFVFPARRTDLLPGPNRMLHLAVGIGFAAQAVVTFVPPVMRAFDVVPGTLPVGAWVAGAILAAWGLAEIASRLVWRKR
jgi:Ca2+-transporting ATPase